jgi:hypothetical protein
MRVSENAGANWKSGAADYEYNGVFQPSGAAGVQIGDASQGDDKIVLTGAAGNAAGEGISGTIRIFGPAATANHNFTADLVQWTSQATSELRRYSVAGGYNGSTNAINGVRFYMQAGNIASGVIALYGLRK